MRDLFFNSYQKRYNEVLNMHCKERGFCTNCQCEVSIVKKRVPNNFMTYTCSKCGRMIESWDIDGSGLPVNKYTM